jgi:hypothetical protein
VEAAFENPNARRERIHLEHSIRGNQTDRPPTEILDIHGETAMPEFVRGGRLNRAAEPVILCLWVFGYQSL